MSDAVKYYIAQLTPDLFRQEQTNVGIIVLKGDEVAAKFIGERAIGELDKRQFKAMDAPDVYVQWVDYWRRILKKPELVEPDLFAANGGNFNVIRGGEVGNINDDSAKNVVDYLYPLLVSDGGLIEAIGKREAAEGLPDTKLKKLIHQAFSEADILDSGTESLLMPPHPIRKEAPITGKLATHNPAYSQHNGKLTVMEVIDFNTRYKSHAKDHAGFAAFIFKDIKEAPGRGDTDAIAIIQLAVAEMNDPTVDYGMSLLKKTANEIVNWTMTPERNRFLERCIENSKGSSTP
jgi:hypothetical protein